MAEELKATAEEIKQNVVSAYGNVKQAFSSTPPFVNAYIPWDSPGVETIKPDEEEKIAQIQEVVSRMQKRNFAKHRHAFTGTHVKTQGIVKGELHVNDNLPDHLRQGIFSEPGKTYQVAARYANEPYLLQADQEPGPRGLSMKVFGVSGPRLEGTAESATTQDFFFNNAPAIELKDIDTTLEIMSLREQHFDNPTMLGLKLKMRTDALLQHAPYLLPNTNIISHSLYTQSAYRFGKYYGHIGMFPVLEEQKQSSEEVTKSDPEGILSDRLFDYFQGREAKYEIKVIAGNTESMWFRIKLTIHRFSSEPIQLITLPKTAVLCGTKQLHLISHLVS